MTCLPNMSPQKSVKVADSRLLILSMDISKFGKKRPGFHLVFAMKKTSRTVGRKMITKKGACGMVKRQHKNNGCTYTYKKTTCRTRFVRSISPYFSEGLRSAMQQEWNLETSKKTWGAGHFTGNSFTPE